ncbi:MAG: FHA domain-containing protein [Chloroflexota bacterium]|nr:FHA domain-containing protein [Chloroflexota bacterium]
MATFLLVLRLLLSLILYAFLGLALYVLWRNLQVDAQPPREPTPTPAHLRGEDEQLFTLQPFTSVGRAASNIIVLTDPFASNHHALISWREADWWLEDRESHNGTFLNREVVTAPVPLTTGDALMFGETELQFTEERDTDKRRLRSQNKSDKSVFICVNLRPKK